jgi:4-hydroxy-3-methylbut-2-enyl diphosphate reductase
MLASDTQAIADHLKKIMADRFGEENIESHFADTRDTLCYATNDNQTAVIQMLESKADLALVIGGYNSSNTSHLVELCELKLPTYFITNEEKIVSADLIRHFDLHRKTETETRNWLPASSPLRVLITSGASCPDAIVEEVMNKLVSCVPGALSLEDASHAI